MGLSTLGVERSFESNCSASLCCVMRQCFAMQSQMIIGVWESVRSLIWIWSPWLGACLPGAGNDAWLAPMGGRHHLHWRCARSAASLFTRRGWAESGFARVESARVFCIYRASPASRRRPICMSADQQHSCTRAHSGLMSVEEVKRWVGVGLTRPCYLAKERNERISPRYNMAVW